MFYKQWVLLFPQRRRNNGLTLKCILLASRKLYFDALSDLWHFTGGKSYDQYIFVTGVVSACKGITAASLGRLLKARGLKVAAQKLDPYINVDLGTRVPISTGRFMFETVLKPTLTLTLRKIYRRGFK